MHEKINSLRRRHKVKVIIGVLSRLNMDIAIGHCLNEDADSNHAFLVIMEKYVLFRGKFENAHTSFFIVSKQIISLGVMALES